MFATKLGLRALPHPRLRALPQLQPQPPLRTLLYHNRLITTPAAAARLPHPTLPPRHLATSFILLYTLSWLLSVPPHKLLPPLLFDAPDTPHTLIDEAALLTIPYPENLDLTNDHFFDTLSRARPLKYGFHLREAHAHILECRRRRKDGGEMGEVERRWKVRWVRLWILDQREGAWRTREGCRSRTLERRVREWMGWDVENVVGELVRMGFVDVRES